MKFDFDQIRRENPLPDVVRQSGVDLQSDGQEFIACCPMHGEKTPSFSVYQKNGKWSYHCFGCGAHGDVIDYVRDIYAYKDAGEAAAYLSGQDPSRKALTPTEYKERSNPYDNYDILRPPSDAPQIVAGVKTPPLLNPKRVNPQNGQPKIVRYNPSMVFPYRDKAGELIGYVLRVEFDDKKITPGIWWMKNEQAKFEGWSHGSFPSPRPLYGLDKIIARPEAQVLIVEGEKCSDAAQTVMDDQKHNVVAVSWMGGGKSISKTSFKSLKDRSVILWPDNDAEGWRTMFGYPRPGGSWSEGILERCYAAGAKRVKVVHITPATRPEGWDIADALYGTAQNDFTDKLTPQNICMIMRAQIQEWPLSRFLEWKKKEIDKAMPQGVEEEADEHPAEEDNSETTTDQQEAGASGGEQDSGSSEPPAKRAGRGFEIDADNWRQHLVMKADGDGLKSNSSQNIALCLQYEHRFAGIFAWNEFASEVFLMRRPPWDVSGNHNFWRPRKLADTDVTACSGWLEYCGLAPKMNDVGKIIMRVAEHNKYNHVKTSIEALKWDGVPRLFGGMTEEGDSVEPWVVRYFGADNTEINKIFGAKWMIGAINRAMHPGCKMDTMIILEGPQGLKKSTALRVLSDSLCEGVFTDEMSDPNSKDAGLQMQGMLVVEVAELDAFRKAEISQIKAWLTRQKDRFRRPYGKVVEEFPRGCVFAGTVNPIGDTGYLKDATGARRFWPVKCHAIDIEGLAEDGKQLWAEAYHHYQQKAQFWLTEREEALAKEVQKERYETDPFGEMVDELAKGLNTVSLLQLMNQLEIPKKDRNAIMAKRITSHLVTNGWSKKVRGGKIVYDRNDQTVLEY